MVVTGASSGVGRAVARAAGERGAKVVVGARGEDGLNAAVEEIERAGSEALAVAGDVAQREYSVAISLVLPGAINTPQFDRDRQKIGKQPQTVPPIYEPQPYAEAVLRCAEKPIRELPVSWGAQKLLWGQKLSPRAGDWMLRRIGWKNQHTDQDKPVNSPDNLFEPLSGDPGAHGPFDGQAKDSSLWTRLRLLIPKG